MKYGHLERLRVELTVRSPLYIGSGEKLTAMEYILDNGVVYVPSISEMIDDFSHAWQRGLMDDFMRFISAPGRQKQLASFLRERRISLNPQPSWVRYTLRAQRDFSSMNTLLTFMRNSDGEAYIPGSSVKGALRTALIAARMNDADKRRLRDELVSNPTGRRASAVEETLRVLPCRLDRDGIAPNRKDAVNDLLKSVEISDSMPFAPESLTVCRRHWLSAAGEDRPGKAPIFMECLRPGAGTAFYMTVDRSLWPEGEDALSTIRDALTEWDALCHRAVDDHFARSLAETGTMKGAPIVLGGGTGFQRKSLVYKTSAYPEDAAQLAHEVLRRQFTRGTRCSYKPPQGAKTAPYMYKAARYEGEYWPLGVCELWF